MANKRRRLYKTRKRASSDSERQELIRETQKMINDANARLRSLERHYKTGTWASKRLKNYLNESKLDFWSTRYGGSIKKIPANINKTTLFALHRRLRNFLNSQTAYHTGIKSVREKQIKDIYERFRKEDPELSDLERNMIEEEIDNELTQRESEALYELFGTKSFDLLAEKIGSSELQVELVEARENEDTEDQWIERIEKYFSVYDDDDLYNAVIDVYEKFVK